MRQVKKYCTYHLEVNYINGDKEILKINGIHEKGNKKEAMDFYRREKDKYIQDSKVATIEFIGTTPEGKTWVQFVKEVNVKKEQTTDDFIQENLDSSVSENLKQVYNIFQLIKAQEDYSKDLINMCNKQRDTLLHQIEFVDNMTFTDEIEKNAFKVDIFDNLKTVSERRRFGKETLETITKFKNTCRDKQNTSIDGILGVIKPWMNKAVKDGITPKEYTDQVQKTVKYKNDKERLHYMSQFQNKYDKVVNDSAKKELYFYNKVGKGKLKNKKVI